MQLPVSCAPKNVKPTTLLLTVCIIETGSTFGELALLNDDCTDADADDDDDDQSWV